MIPTKARYNAAQPKSDWIEKIGTEDKPWSNTNISFRKLLLITSTCSTSWHRAGKSYTSDWRG